MASVLASWPVVADLPGVDHGDGHAGRGEFGGSGALDAAGSLHHHERGAGAEPAQTREPVVVVGEPVGVAG